MCTQSCHIRIGSRLQKTHACSYDKEDTEISPVLFQDSSRKKEQASDCRQHQAKDNPCLITVTFHKHSNRDRENKISQPVGSLGKGGFKGIQFTCLHQLSDHGRKQITADRPQKEKTENKCERNGICIFLHLHNYCFMV